jgi:hypothetical protein
MPQMQSFVTHHETVRTLQTRRLPVQIVRELETKNKSQNKNKNHKMQISLHMTHKTALTNKYDL